MDSAKDYGFHDGFLLDNGTDVPADHTSAGSINGSQQVVYPNATLEQNQSDYLNAVGSQGFKNYDTQSFAQTHAAAQTVLNATGITRTANPTNVQVGVDPQGNKIYTNPQLANNTSTSGGQQLAQTTGIALGAMGAFDNHAETSKFVGIGNNASNPDFHTQLDAARTNQDPKAFNALLGQSTGSPLDKNSSGYTGYQLYQNWNNLSPAQKSIGITGVGIQGFKFNNGDTVATKQLTPALPDTPAMSVAEGLGLAASGANVAPAVTKWGQLSALQNTMYQPKTAGDVVQTANSLGILGYGQEGTAVPMTAKTMQASQLTPAPHLGIGAATMPAGVGMPQGYVAAGKVAAGTVVVPAANQGTVNLNTPDIATGAASQIYSGWKDGDTATQTKGVMGGSALVGGLHSMTQTNPYTLGAMVGHSTYNNVPDAAKTSPLGYATGMSGITMQRLLNGGSSVSTDQAGAANQIEGAMTPDSYAAAMKNMKGVYSQNGIPSKEAGYQLVNQAYSENRLNETEAVAAHKSLDMTFDDNGYTLAQKLMTGRDKATALNDQRSGQ